MPNGKSFIHLTGCKNKESLLNCVLFIRKMAKRESSFFWNLSSWKHWTFMLDELVNLISKM